jgi:hypothetical protein
MEIIKDLIGVVAILVGYLVLTVWILPKLGVET